MQGTRPEFGAVWAEFASKKKRKEEVRRSRRRERSSERASATNWNTEGGHAVPYLPTRRNTPALD